MVEKIYINGIELASEAVKIESMTGVWNAPGIRGSDYDVPGRHGVIRNPIRMYQSAQVTFPLFVTGVHPSTGDTDPDGHVGQLRANVKYLIRLFSGDLTITHEYPDGSTIQALGRLAYNPMEFERQTSFPESARLGFVVDIPGGFWSDTNLTSQSFTTVTDTTLNWTNFSGADAPMDELEVTFTGPASNPRIQQGETYLQYNDIVPGGTTVTFYPDMTYKGNDGVNDFDLDYSKIQHFGSARWFELIPGDPAQTLFTHTGSGTSQVTLTGRKKYLIG